MSQETIAEVHELRSRLRTLLRQARANEEILRRNQALELRLIGSEGLLELLDNVLEGYRQASRLDLVGLALADPEFETRRMLAGLGADEAGLRGLVFVEDPAVLESALGSARAPWLGPYSAARHGLLFAAEAPSSVALVPLVRHARLIGALALGSHQRRRFEPGLGTDFLERIAAIVAICIENVMNAERLKQMGLTDPLTGVHNRRYLEQRLLEEVGRALRGGFALSCLFLDADHFKRINDTHGHLVGDWVLREIAQRIKSQLRLSDALARYGGEEFAALLVQTDESAAQGIAERIRRAVGETPFRMVDGTGLAVTVSVGVASIDETAAAQTPEAAARLLLDGADRAVYRAKEAGRNCVMRAAR